MGNSRLQTTELEDWQRVGQLYEMLFSRDPVASEIERDLQFIDRYELATSKLAPADRASLRLRAWQALCRVLVATNEFIYVVVPDKFHNFLQIEGAWIA